MGKGSAYWQEVELRGGSQGGLRTRGGNARAIWHWAGVQSATLGHRSLEAPARVLAALDGVQQLGDIRVQAAAPLQPGSRRLGAAGRGPGAT